jgi:HlyD family secretion protein
LKKLFLILVLLALGGGVVAFVLRSQAPKPAADESSAVKTLKVERGNIDLRLSSTGKVISNLDVEIKSKASGQIRRLPYDISDKVSSGTLLAELDPVDELRNVAQREAVMSSARARLAQAVEQYNISQIERDTETSRAQADLNAAIIKNHDSQSKVARQRDLFKKRLISKEELDTAESDAATAANALLQAQTRIQDTASLPRQVEMKKQDVVLQKAAQMQAQVDLENAQQRLQETRIYAPMDGIITSRPVQEGQIIASGISNVGGGTTLMTLSDLSRIFISANVDESDVGKVKVGQHAVITADAFPGKRFRGRIDRIAPKGTTTNNVVTFEVKIEIEGEAKDLLKPEMTGNVDIQADSHENILILPNDAVMYGREGYFVTVPDGPGKSKRVPVKTGLTDGLYTEITEGLKEGQEVVIGSTVQSRWSQAGQDQANAGAQGKQRSGGQNFSRGVQRAAFGLSGAGRRH